MTMCGISVQFIELLRFININIVFMKFLQCRWSEIYIDSLSILAQEFLELH